MRNHSGLLLLFDVDGTLVNVRPGLSREIFFETLAEIHRLEEISVEDGYTFHGRTDLSIYADLCRFSGINDADAEAGAEEFVSRLVERWGKELDPSCVTLLDGVTEILDQLEGEGVDHRGLLTGNVEAGARAKLQPHKLFDRFRGGAFGSDSPDRNSLPPIALKRVSSLTGRSWGPERSVIIGDSHRDIECAHANGLKVIAVATGGSESEELERHSPDLLVESLNESDRIFSFLNRIR